MALQGKVTWKGIEIDGAYVMVDAVHSNSAHELKQEEKTPAVFNEDGTVKTEAVYESSWEKKVYGHYSVTVYATKAKRDEDPLGNLYKFSNSFTPSHAASAKCDYKQAYEHLKAIEDYKDLASV